MSRVVEHGNQWYGKRKAWYGERVTCSRCNCVFALTEKSRFNHTTGVGSVGYFEAYDIQCPECENTGNRKRKFNRLYEDDFLSILASGNLPIWLTIHSATNVRRDSL